MKKFNLIACLLFIFISCKSEDKTTLSNQNPEIESVSIVDTLSLKLNVDEKWRANLETHQGITKMDSIITVFKANNKTDYKALGKDLSKQTGYIIKHCSMKGEPHDQLHVVLIPMLDEISVLREENNQDKTTSALHNLELLISTYFKFFKV